jgi:MFS family permease
MGMLTDRFGGRVVFTVLFVLVTAAVAIIPLAHDFNTLVLYAFFVGPAGSSFIVAVGFLPRWFGREKQGTALGVYGLGNMGHSAAVVLGPVIAAAAYGRNVVCWGVAPIALVWGIIVFAVARNAPVSRKPTTVGDMVKVLATEKLAWVLSAFYFLTFGGFVVFSIYLPTLLRDHFGRFFHVFQRPAQMGVKLYQWVGDHDERTHCVRCGNRFASRMQTDDLRQVLPQLGFDYRIEGPAATWQNFCPPCKRTTIATAQLRLREEARG